MDRSEDRGKGSSLMPFPQRKSPAASAIAPGPMPENLSQGNQNTSNGSTAPAEPTISRRSLLGGLAMVAVAAPAAAMTPPGRTPSAQEAWDVFVATIADRLAEGDRLQVFGSVSSVRAEIYRSRIEQVHPKVLMPVERIVASYRMTADGWQSEGYYS